MASRAPLAPRVPAPSPVARALEVHTSSQQSAEPSLEALLEQEQYDAVLSALAPQRAASPNDARLLYRAARDLLFHGTEAGQKPVRLIGISVSSLIGEGEPEQLALPFLSPSAGS